MPTLKVGEVVRVLEDAEKVKALQKRHGGWSSDMVDVGIKQRNSVSVNQAGPRSSVGNASDSRARCPGFDTRSGHILLFLLPLIQKE